MVKSILTTVECLPLQKFCSHAESGSLAFGSRIVDLSGIRVVGWLKVYTLTYNNLLSKKS